ncbi:MAG TPA: citrate transporter [Candidatus Eubacterium avistercoris]|uniref:Citrate transporter n=1 Tax=Candidatus Eubacterium avistercoris TaxID=2838567 RepID=A0A9D2D458_9FIRM|nr:citrate transporter [Candidatus Eubacterium avistercoris]
MEKIKTFFRRETVFCISFLLAVLSALAVRPDRAYLSYPDYRTLALLFCLMIIVAGFQSLGVFSLLGQTLLKRADSLRRMSVFLVLLCFFCSMVITNDVTLITFVPFTVLVFRMVKMEDKVLKLIVLETIAANLGSMATPIGNPQNLYLYSASGLSTSQFVFAVIPYAGLSLILLLAVLLIQKNEPLADTAEEISQTKEPEGKRMTAVLPYLCLLLLCLLVVFRILPFLPVLICVGAAVLFINRRLYASVDYFLLLTFLCFFVFIGNVKRMPGISGLLFSLVDGRELWAGILTSQVISNVPAAILLSGFTDNFAALLTAVNLGGLGTLIASLASLISFQSYTRAYPEKKRAFLKVFTVWNLTFLVILAAAAMVLNGMSGRS